MQGVVPTGLVSLSLSNEWTGANGAYERRPDACKRGPHTHSPSHTNCRAPTIGQQCVTHWSEHAMYIWAVPRLTRILRPWNAYPVADYFFFALKQGEARILDLGIVMGRSLEIV